MNRLMTDLGIIMIAGGLNYYGKCAYNLALSIKATSDVPIILYYHDEGIRHLTPKHLTIFDQVKLIPSKYCDKGSSYCMTKLYLDKMTPYKRTMYLDVDMVVLPKLDIETMYSDFNMANRGVVDGGRGFGGWCDVNEFKKDHSIDRYLDVSSEVITFDNKTKVFSEARKASKNKQGLRHFSGGFPDEPFFTVGIEKAGVNLEKWRPSFWQLEMKKVPSHNELYHGYYLMSIGGNIIPNASRQIYYNLTNAYARKLQMPKAFDIPDKRRALKQRIHL